MEKVIYWLKKLGLLRSASYKVKGDASKLNEVNATDGGMLQSQKEIDKKVVKESEGKKSPNKKGNKKNRILFWIFVFLALFFLLAFFGNGFSFWSFVTTILWIFFLVLLWKGNVAWATSIVKVLVIGFVLVVLSLSFVGPSETEKEDSSKMDESTISTSEKENTKEEDEKCDDANSEHASFNKVEKVIVSKKPCKVPWILAKESESYTLETKKGTSLQVIVWNNYENNVKAGKSYTIRALDVKDSQEERGEAGIAIVRWVPNKANLTEAKKEVKKVVENLKY